MTVQVRYHDMSGVEHVRTLVKSRMSIRFHMGVFDFFFNSSSRPTVYMRDGTDVTVNYVFHTDEAGVNGTLVVPLCSDKMCAVDTTQATYRADASADGVRAQLVCTPSNCEGQWRAERLQFDVRENASHRSMRAAVPLDEKPRHKTEHRRPHDQPYARPHYRPYDSRSYEWRYEARDKARPYERRDEARASERRDEARDKARASERWDEARERWCRVLEDDTRTFLDFLRQCRGGDERYVLHHAREFVHRMGFACDTLDMCLKANK